MSISSAVYSRNKMGPKTDPVERRVTTGAWQTGVLYRKLAENARKEMMKSSRRRIHGHEIWSAIISAESRDPRSQRLH